ncbi:TolB family protein [Microcoleus sp. FACHB-672]|uniref:TolB family protein n=1 Tax=Microcoleus sp. FACHB-672 TaxID=2692825 RepID=UPI00168365FE|nr:PD40 domain-containing protein [Microcoleus sp. FACHB-672]MBD2040556.1 TolB family protein [Microcoleus sp. FACHB-672]
MNRFTPKWSIHRWLTLSVASLAVACSPVNRTLEPVAINSRYTDEQPALSGNGRFLAFVSNREGSRNILLYDRQTQQYVNLPYLNRPDAVADSPSISNTARYIVYIASDRGRPEVELYDRVTKRPEVLTRGYVGWVRNPSISPDGRYIVFESGRRGQWDIEMIDRGPTIELDRLNGGPSK